MKYTDWKKRRDELASDIELKRRAYEAAYRDLLAHENITLLYTLQSGTRVTITDAAGGSPQISMSDSAGFVTIAIAQPEDLREVAEIKRAIAAWKAGTLDDLPTPAVAYARWRPPHPERCP